MEILKESEIVNMNKTQENVNSSYDNVITYMSFDEWENINEDMEKRRDIKRLKERHRKARYFKRQRCLGAIIMLVGTICLISGSIITKTILQYFGLIIGFVGLYIMYTKQMIVVDGYYLECQDRINKF